mmetsp:Transcript_44575/g.140675  ORF Transcript_44575/g.140675 Transcript_44575/m.140675 type:complete len:214 (+) Transcript_44575:1794-2435(+)
MATCVTVAHSHRPLSALLSTLVILESLSGMCDEFISKLQQHRDSFALDTLLLSPSAPAHDAKEGFQHDIFTQGSTLLSSPRYLRPSLLLPCVSRKIHDLQLCCVHHPAAIPSPNLEGEQAVHLQRRPIATSSPPFILSVAVVQSAVYKLLQLLLAVDHDLVKALHEESLARVLAHMETSSIVPHVTSRKQAIQQDFVRDLPPRHVRLDWSCNS